MARQKGTHTRYVDRREQQGLGTPLLRGADQGRPGQQPGREGFLRAVAEDHAAYSDLQYLIVEQMAAEGGRVVSRLRLRGTHDRGPSMSFAPTGKVYEDTAIVIHRLSE